MRRADNLGLKARAKMGQIADLVILRVPFVRIVCLFEPLLILGNGEKIDPLFSSCDLHQLIPMRSRVTKEELTRTMGVTNSTKKLGTFNKDGKKWSKKLMRSPFMCEPS